MICDDCNLDSVTLRAGSDSDTPALSRLPPELLTLILLEYVRDYRRNYEQSSCDGEEPRDFSPYGWIRVSEVCNIWRNCVFATPRLWTVIYFTRPEDVDAALKYSGQLLLTVKPSRFEPRVSVYLVTQMLLPLRYHVHRLEHIELPEFYGGAWRVEPSKEYSHVASNLQSLSIAVLDRHAPSFIPLLSNLSFPCLSAVSLSGFGECWHLVKHFVVPTVTRLRLINTDMKPDLPALLHVLSDLPSLKELELHNPYVLSAAHSAELWLGSGLPIISFPYLTALNVSEIVRDNHGSRSAALLAHIDIPSTCKISLGLLGQCSPATFADAALVVHSNLSQNSDQSFNPHPFRSCSITHFAATDGFGRNTWGRLEFYLWVANQDFEACHNRCTVPEVHLEVGDNELLHYHDGRIQFVPLVIREFLRTPFYFTAVSTLVVKVPCDAGCWQQIQRSMPNLEQLSIWYNITSHAFLSAMDSDGHAFDTGLEHPAFPVLQILEIGSVEWCQHSCYGRDKPESLGERIIRVFSTRMANDRSRMLTRLVIGNPYNLKEDAIRALRSSGISEDVVVADPEDMVERECEVCNELDLE